MKVKCSNFLMRALSISFLGQLYVKDSNGCGYISYATELNILNNQTGNTPIKILFTKNT